MHHQYRLSILQWNPGPARRNPTQIVAATCGSFHAVIPQEASDQVLHVSDQFIAYTGNTELGILLNRDTFEPNLAVFAFQDASSSKDTLGMVVVVGRGLLRRPSLSALSTSTILRRRNVMPPLTCSAAYMRTCCSRTSTSLGVTFNMSLYCW